MRTVDEIVARSLEGGQISRQNVTATAMRAYAVSPYACYCHFHVDPKLKDPPTRFGDLLKNWGLRLEQTYVDRRDATARAQRFSYDSDGFREFVRLAVRGEKYIYNPAVFWLGLNLAGKPDLLVRDDSAPS